MTLVTDFLALVKDALKDPDATKYPNDLVVRQAQVQAANMVRRLSRANKHYHNFSIGLRDTLARQILNQTFEYRLPSWTTHVIDVFEQSSPAGDDNLSPYVWANNNVQVGRQIAKSQFGPGLRWTWEGQYTLRLWNAPSAMHLLVRLVKTPPRMFQAKLGQQSTTARTAVLPAQFLISEPEDVDGAYLNAEIIVTTAFDDANYGLEERIVNSDPRYTGGGGRQHRITFSADLPLVLKKDDILTSRVTVIEEHVRYLTLLTARSCMQRVAHGPGLAAIRDELAYEEQQFEEYATGPRDEAGPSFYRNGSRSTQSLNPDRDRPWF